ncbi:DUF6166 domain-containing protein [Pseudomonas prosekii]|uniref:Uncharacterized protein n=1 Tax=Pseudomonas prosekii TaxID=1148509 RepID=A0A2U2DD60_9PSED|nr:DUF6166 domain-containing protein [Pseudomonas prosekii]PWE47264.1 hypothetical protein C9I49_04130 [Pseudomonas prosekii]
MSEFKRPENGYLGEARSKALLSKNFWVLTRSVDADSADIIVQLKVETTQELISKRTKTVELGYVQSKYFEGKNQVKILRSYVDDPEAPFRKGFFALVHTDDAEDRAVNYFFTAQEIQSHWYLNEAKDHYCFSLTQDREYKDFRNIPPRLMRDAIEEGIRDLKSSVESLISRGFISMNSNTRNIHAPPGKYVLTRPYNCPTAIYIDSEGCSSPLDPRKDVFPYSGYFEWGYEGTAPKFLATSILTHFLGGDIPDNSAIDALFGYLIVRLDRYSPEDHEIDAEMILRALSYIPYPSTDITSQAELKELYEITRKKYDKYLSKS